MKASTQQNPFKLQSDNKKFFSSLAIVQQSQPIQDISHFENGLNRIKNMNKQLEELAKKRQQMMFKDSQMDYIFKKEKPNLSINDFITSIPSGNANQKDKKFRVRALLKQKKQSVHQFLEKKKQIYLSKMNINIKKQETIKLSDYIKDEEQTLKARKLYFDNDVQFMQKFIQSIKKQADQAQCSVQSQLKTQQILVSKLNSLQAQTQKLDNLISKDEQTLKNLQCYKQFIDSFYDEQRNWKPFINKVIPNQQVMFMTQNMSGLVGHNQIDFNGGLVVRYQPENLLEIFNNAEENNIREIQNLHDKEDQLEHFVKDQLKSKITLDKIVIENQDKISALLKKLEQKTAECAKFKQLKKNNSSNKINILDGQNLDIEKISLKIFEIYNEIDSKDGRRNQDMSQKGIKHAMTIIQQDIQQLRSLISSTRQQHPSLIKQIQSQIKHNQRKQNISRKLQQAKQLELKKQRDQQKKRNQPHNQKFKGRKDMTKVLMEKKVKKRQVKEERQDNDQERYLQEDGRP